MDDAGRNLAEMRALHQCLERARTAHLGGDVTTAQDECNSIIARLADRALPYRLHFLNSIERLWETEPGPELGAVPPLSGHDVFAELHTSLSRKIRSLGAPVWSAENPRPLARDTENKAAIWTCGASQDHPAWSASVWEVRRGRPCPTCLNGTGLPPDAWEPPDIPYGPLVGTPCPTYS